MIKTFENKHHSVCVVGAGIAGLTSAIKLKLRDPELQIVILEKRIPESNTQIAGMRFREHKAADGKNPFQELQELLAYTESPKRSRQFSQNILQELLFWQQLHETSVFVANDKEIPPLQVAENPNWFGPQWEEGKGKNVLDWLKQVAQTLGIQVIKSEVLEIVREGKLITSLVAERQKNRTAREKEYFRIRANSYVIASGSASGFLTASTNKKIRRSMAQLALESELPLVGLTNNMFHPFGRCRPDGSPLPGCFATDELAGAEVYLSNGELDQEITRLLETHQAHDRFREIIERFISVAGEPVVTLKYPDGRIAHARISHHYCQLGLLTTDGVSVEGMSNLYAVGDAEGWYLTNHQKRLPGFALSKCLVDAQLASEILPQSQKNQEGFGIEIEASASPATIEANSYDEESSWAIRTCNTHYLLQVFTNEGQPDKLRDIIKKWQKELANLGEKFGMYHPVLELSLAMIAAHQQRYCQETQEPININKQVIAELRREIGRELFIPIEGARIAKERY